MFGLPETKSVELLTVPEAAKVGERVTFAGYNVAPQDTEVARANEKVGSQRVNFL